MDIPDLETQWTYLEEKASDNKTAVWSRLSQTDLSVASIELRVRYPDLVRSISLPSPNLESDQNKLPQFRGFKLSLTEENNPDRNLIIQLVDPADKSIFNSLIRELREVIEITDSEEQIVKNVLERLNQWADVLSKLPLHRMSEQELTGLYGELLILERLLKTTVTEREILESWTGPNNQGSDFQFSEGIAIEVKASTSLKSQEVSISSERQLDPQTAENLFLTHIVLEKNRASGETVNDLIWRLNERLRARTLVARFRKLLLSAGYNEQDAEYYSDTRFTERSVKIYRVTDDFPKIERGTLPPEVSNVKYSLNLSGCDGFKISESKLFELIVRDE